MNASSRARRSAEEQAKLEERKVRIRDALSLRLVVDDREEDDVKASEDYWRWESDDVVVARGGGAEEEKEGDYDRDGERGSDEENPRRAQPGERREPDRNGASRDPSSSAGEGAAAAPGPPPSPSQKPRPAPSSTRRYIDALDCGGQSASVRRYADALDCGGHSNSSQGGRAGDSLLGACSGHAGAVDCSVRGRRRAAGGGTRRRPERSRFLR